MKVETTRFVRLSHKLAQASISVVCGDVISASVD